MAGLPVASHAARNRLPRRRLPRRADAWMQGSAPVCGRRDLDSFPHTRRLLPAHRTKHPVRAGKGNAMETAIERSAETTLEVKPVGGTTPADHMLVHVPARKDASKDKSFFEHLLDLFGGLRTVGAAICATLITGVWLSLFTMGIAIPSEPYRNRMLAMASPDGVSANAPGILESLTVIAFAYTPTNLALLCCAAALAGCLGRMATMRNGETTDEPSDQASTGQGSAGSVAEKKPDSSLLAPAMSAVTWGFFVYLVLISGTIVLTGDPFKNTSPEQYFRLAGSASLFAFAVGWQPQILNQLVSTVGKSGLFKGK